MQCASMSRAHFMCASHHFRINDGRLTWYHVINFQTNTHTHTHIKTGLINIYTIYFKRCLFGFFFPSYSKDISSKWNPFLCIIVDRLQIHFDDSHFVFRSYDMLSLTLSSFASSFGCWKLITWFFMHFHHERSRIFHFELNFGALFSVFRCFFISSTSPSSTRRHEKTINQPTTTHNMDDITLFIVEFVWYFLDGSRLRMCFIVHCLAKRFRCMWNSQQTLFNWVSCFSETLFIRKVFCHTCEKNGRFSVREMIPLGMKHLN